MYKINTYRSHYISATILTGEPSKPVNLKGNAYTFLIFLSKIFPMFTSSYMSNGLVLYKSPSSNVLCTLKFVLGPKIELSMLKTSIATAFTFNNSVRMNLAVSSEIAGKSSMYKSDLFRILQYPV